MKILKTKPVRYAVVAMALAAHLVSAFAATAAGFNYYAAVPGLVVTEHVTTPGSGSGSTDTSGGSTGGSTGGTGGSGTGSSGSEPSSTSLSLSTTSINFAGVELGTAAVTRTFQISNGTSQAVSFSAAPQITGAGFSGSSNCTASLAAGASCAVSVTFEPTSAGAFNGAVQVYGKAGDAVQTVSLTGSGFIRASSARWSVSGLAFSGVMVGSSSTKTAYLYNDGNITGDFSQITGLSAGFTANASGCSAVAPNGFCPVLFTFAPTEAKSYSLAGVTTSAPHVNSLTFSGQGLETSVDLSAGSLTFVGQQVSTTSAAQSVLISNTSNTEVTLGELTVSGQFTATTSCGATLPAGQSCAVSVTFAPTSGGLLLGTVALSTSAGTQTVSLSGYGQVPLTASVSSDFLSAVTPSGAFATTTLGSHNDLTVYVLAGGNMGDLNVSASLTGGSEFTVLGAARIYPYYQGGVGYVYDAGACGATVTPTSVTNCSGGPGYLAGPPFPHIALVIRFSPSTTGDKTAVLTIAHNGTNPSPVVVNLSATAKGTPTADLSASSLSWAPTSNPTLVGSSSTQSVRLTNNGSASLSLTSAPVVTGNSAFAAGTTTCGSSLAAGAYCDTQVTFSPVNTTAVTGSLSFATSAGTRTVALLGTGAERALTLSTDSLDFGNQAINTTSALQLVYVTDSGNAPVTVSAVNVTGPFTQTNNCVGGDVPAGATCTVNVRFAPTTVAPATGVLTITSNAGTKTVSLSGQGQGVPTADLSVTSLTWSGTTSPTVVNGSTTQSVRLTNNGSAALTLSSAPSVSGNAAFSATSGCSGTLAVGSYCDTTVQFAPTSTTQVTGLVTFTTSAGTVTVSLTGTGQAQQGTLSAIDFGSIPAGTNSTLTSTLANTGTVPLSVTVPTSSSVSGTNFSFVSTTCTTSLAVGGNCTVSVKYAPATVTTNTGSLQVSTGAGTLSANLNGAASPVYMAATGGTVTTVGNYKIHTFTANGTFTVSQLPTTADIQVLLVGGGGGGAGGGLNVGGGGGGAGGYVTATPTISATGTVTVTVGAGGTGGAYNGTGTSGTASTISGVLGSLSAAGGGKGGTAPGTAGNGGSGGGVSGSSGPVGTPSPAGQGNSGGLGTGTYGASICTGGGGGGYGSAGSNLTGGTGVSNSITGTATTYATGGNGGNTSGGTPAARTGNTGNGGFGGGGTNASGGAGAAGVVIIKYRFQ